ncbi:MAG: formate dehydrogenase subunit gamma [Alphaproteobacteria bacterium]|nr:formate dehydrogenase subunit gamma [Alphaproteobacteria bacterium]
MSERWRLGRLGGLLVLALVAMLMIAGEGLAQSMRPAPGQEPEDFLRQQQNAGRVDVNNAEMWRSVRKGAAAYASIPDARAAILVQSDGERWREFYRGPLKTYGAWYLAAVVAALALFFVIRGRLKIEPAPAGREILRFDGIERFAHWLAAVSFVLLALTGLNISYGRFVMLPWMGAEAFATISQAGKSVHNYLGFSFIVGLVAMFVLWVRDNLPDAYDGPWIANLGGLFWGHDHPDARKFNAGQKFIFWVVILGGGVLAYTGISMMFPFYWLSMANMQLAVLVHAGVSIALIGIMIAHVYIGSLGMEGAFDAMGHGYVDENWAREHHSIWVAETLGEELGGLDAARGRA